MSGGGWVEAAVIALIVAGAAYKVRALRASGAFTAWGIGTLVFACGGWWGTLMLLAFFLPSSVLSFLGRTRKAPLNAEYAKGEARDAAQVIANGALVTLALVAGCAGWIAPATARHLVIGALAAATADTWATEIGGLVATPRLITNGRLVPAGTSGAVSPLGLLAALLGGLWIGGMALLLGRMSGIPTDPLSPLLIGGLGGTVGSLVDSLLGATVQRVYWCPHCEKETERQVHRCGTPTRPLRGWSWMTNDTVNFIATLIGAIIGTLAR